MQITLNFWEGVSLLALSVFLSYHFFQRLKLSAAKHPSLLGHPKILRFLSQFTPSYSLSEREFFNCDGAKKEIAELREEAFLKLSNRLPRINHETKKKLQNSLPDVGFTDRYRVPYQFAKIVNRSLSLDNIVLESKSTQIRDSSNEWFDDLSGSYGVNLFGYDFYKECMRQGNLLTDKLGPVLGPYHPVILDVSEKLREISGLDQVSFHMSGTEAVMQAVRLARYHSGRKKTVQFCGAYHGWWDGVQPGLGNPRKAGDVLTLAEGSTGALKIISQRKDIACVLINPLQAMHPNQNAPGDGTLITLRDQENFNKEKYTKWLKDLRLACDKNDIPLIFDEVFVGFRLAKGGAQEFFGTKADLVTYGKTLGGGYPVGVLCGKTELMRRYDPDRPTDFSFARGTFNSHPNVLGAMKIFLEKLDQKSAQGHYDRLESTWSNRAESLNQRLADLDIPIRVNNMVSVWTVQYTRRSRFHWLFQYYLRANGIALGWVGTGKLIFSHDYSERDFERVADKFVQAACDMKNGKWFSHEVVEEKAVQRSLRKEYLQAFLGRNMSRP